MRRLSELQRLNGRVALVTGATGHLGLAIGEVLVELGAHVVVVDRDPQQCAARAAQLAEHGEVETLAVAADLAVSENARLVVERTLERFERLDILVNNAAFTGATGLSGWAVPFAEQELPAWDAAMRVNVSSAFLLVQAAAPALARSGCGNVLNIGSIYGVSGPDLRLYEGTKMGNPAAYAASKGALLQLTRYLATVLAPSIRVNAISPGGIERGQPEPFQKRYIDRTPLGRMATEEDFKGAVAFLASDASAYVTGQNLLVDGGWTAW